MPDAFSFDGHIRVLQQCIGLCLNTRTSGHTSRPIRGWRGVCNAPGTAVADLAIFVGDGFRDGTALAHTAPC